MPGSVHKPNSMGRVFKEGPASRHRFEDASSALDSESTVDSASPGHQPDQSFGFVGVELVNDEYPGIVGAGVDYSPSVERIRPPLLLLLPWNSPPSTVSLHDSSMIPLLPVGKRALLLQPRASSETDRKYAPSFRRILGEQLAPDTNCCTTYAPLF